VRFEGRSRYLEKEKGMDKGFVVWLTGLPASGKTTIARGLEEELRRRGLKVEVMDGDEVRKGLSRDLGFSKEDREKHAMRVAYVSKLLARNGVAVIVALISPYRSFRDSIREQIENFIEVFVKCPVEECARRDPKGLYAKAFAGEIKDFTGVDDPYEEPLNPELVLDTVAESTGESVRKILDYLRDRDYITA
jgi:adenylylsulfate kinase